MSANGSRGWAVIIVCIFENVCFKNINLPSSLCYFPHSFILFKKNLNLNVVDDEELIKRYLNENYFVEFSVLPEKVLNNFKCE